MPTEAELRAITAQITAAYLAKNAVDAPLDLNDLKASVYDALVDCASIKPWAAVADPVVPLADVAERFQLTERHVRNVVREHGVPVLGRHRTIRFGRRGPCRFQGRPEMPLTVTRRKDNDTLQITGRIDFPPSPEHPEGYQR